MRDQKEQFVFLLDTNAKLFNGSHSVEQIQMYWLGSGSLSYLPIIGRAMIQINVRTYVLKLNAIWRLNMIDNKLIPMGNVQNISVEFAKKI